MKLRHAAALAITGWYLLLPPSDTNAPGGDVSAPLPNWTRSGYHEYESREDCEYDLDKERDRLRHLGRTLSEQATDAAAQCVSADDPRLEAK